jgi:filamentous hemagglutinin
MRFLLETRRILLLRSTQNTDLKKYVDCLYRKSASIGAGSTADAIRYELQTGNLLSRQGHLEKGITVRHSLFKLFREKTLSPPDEQTAKNLLIDLQDALSTERNVRRNKP